MKIYSSATAAIALACLITTAAADAKDCRDFYASVPHETGPVASPSPGGRATAVSQSRERMQSTPNPANDPRWN